MLLGLQSSLAQDTESNTSPEPAAGLEDFAAPPPYRLPRFTTFSPVAFGSVLALLEEGQKCSVGPWPGLGASELPLG